MLLLAALTAPLAACSSDTTAPSVTSGTTSADGSTDRVAVSSTTAPAAATALGPAVPAMLGALLDTAAGDRVLATGDDRWEVWICHVPVDTTAGRYAGLAVRLPLTPSGVAAVVEQHVARYFATISHGAYRPTFVAGGEITMRADEEPESCLDQAASRAGTTTRAVLAVADSEHVLGAPGGFGRPGSGCAQPPSCPVAASGRGAYVGASDFHPDWGGRPPMDLVEHEIGHTLGWPHSGTVTEPDGTIDYESALDVMGDSAAPRTLDPTRRDGPDTLAINRLTAGWLPLVDVAVVPPTGSTVSLAPSTGSTGVRLAVIGLDDSRMLTVEVLVADDFDAHLPAAGVAVHLVDTSVSPRSVTPLTGDLALLGVGQSLDAEGWRITVTAEWQVSLTRV